METVFDHNITKEEREAPYWVLRMSPKKDLNLWGLLSVTITGLFIVFTHIGETM